MTDFVRRWWATDPGGVVLAGTPLVALIAGVAATVIVRWSL